jgi:phage shock protein PspC (stress-responsive transcriptional regulator)
MDLEEKIYTAITVLTVLAVLSFWGFIVYIAWHFISKYW